MGLPVKEGLKMTCI